MEIAVVKNRNTIAIHPASKVLTRLVKELRFTRREQSYDYKSIKSGNTNKYETVLLYQYDKESDTLTTFAGFIDRVYSIIAELGHVPILSEPNKPFEYEPVIEAISGIDLRGAQSKMIATACSCDRAQFNGVTGMGKSVLVSQLCRIYPYPDFNIVICAQQRPVVTALYKAVSKYFPHDTGKIGGGSNSPARITVSTAASLLKVPSPNKINMFIYDEVHTAGGRSISNKLGYFTNARMYGLSASTECRTDNADRLIEALFGPVRVTIDMKEGQDEGYIPPVNAHFYNTYTPTINSKVPSTRKREGIWNNFTRNNAIISVAKYWESKVDNPQILIMTDALEHVLRLQQQLPDYDIIYASANKDRLDKFKREGLIPDDYKALTDKQRENKIADFEIGKLRKVISTTTLGVGVDAPGLDVIIRADGGSSEISNIQFRGRVMRGDSGVYCDFLDTGDEGMKRKAQSRRKSAEKAGWPVQIEELP